MISSDLGLAVKLLRAGEVVAFPTETVYGLGAVAFDTQAVARIFEIKRRPRFDPLIVHAATAEAAFDLCATVSTLARELAAAFWPGPLTLVLPKNSAVPDLVTAGLASVAVRVPAHGAALELLSAVGVPLAAPSANSFGRLSPTTAAHVHSDLGSAISLILDGGPSQAGIESTIISLVQERPQLLRAGAIPPETLIPLIGHVQIVSQHECKPLAPGQMRSHYAARTPMQSLDAAAPPHPSERVGLLAVSPRSATGYAAVEVLSATGDLCESAANLFAALHRLDEQNLDRIVCEFAPAEGLGLAINDRLRRGCQR
jgi:L-threonylcarbamoyladenylate synthase